MYDILRIRFGQTPRRPSNGEGGGNIKKNKKTVLYTETRAAMRGVRDWRLTCDNDNGIVLPHVHGGRPLDRNTLHARIHVPRGRRLMFGGGPVAAVNGF